MSASKKTKYSFIAIALLPICVGLFVFLLFSTEKKLPIFNATDFNSELVDLSIQGSLNKHKVANFSLIDQNNTPITQENYKDKIYVADFFFTRCPNICPIMANHMKKLQKAFLNDDDVMFLSMSVTPEIDSVSVLRKYANKHGAIDGKWHITTGDKKHIYELARKSYFAVINQGDGGLQDFIHTPNFILIDKKNRIRGVYNGTSDKDVSRLAIDIKTLQKEDL
ncbi:SCO family protein [Zobellia galactanivorans]|uniref:SCO family protein n=1 Tax=Zobellia galactanivorans (strain DSM 12802 / CCUG 47099 / CIP 106680 / NCIMB 13871 / Dsij) TaxID=63186 RepID=UPI001C065C09|nr:SCO family protein [Zobellia galactanivorans]MBU3024470.1 SCO family protein [Zobellia galactanivorans]MDO6807573.1 SCO family protein [Zobellia galactanivorans]